MLTLLDLPEEIFVIIINQLDLLSVYSFYNVCRVTRRIVQISGVVKMFNISLSNMATVQSLKLNFFKDVASNLQELNMSGVPDLNKTQLLRTAKKLKQLKTLDVSYTNININDFLELYELCPTIKNISINFVFGKLGLSIITSQILKQCQSVFKNFNNIHFVGSLSNLLYSKIAFCILDKVKLKTLRYSVTECDYVCTTSLPNDPSDANFEPHFNHFNIAIVNWQEYNIYYQKINSLPALVVLDWDKYEFIITVMMSVNRYIVYSSPFFKDFFDRNFGINAICTTNIQKPLVGNCSILIWKKGENDFDAVFFNKLFIYLKQYFPKFCPSKFCTTQKFDWFHIVPEDTCMEARNAPRYDSELRKRRLGAPSLVLDYDNMFKEKKKIQVSFMFHDHMRNTISLQSDFNYLSKITFLCLSGSVRYSSNFFNILFSCCCNLITLNIEAPTVFPCASPISKGLPLSKSLKNIRLLDRRIDFKSLILAFSNCITLENIYVIEDSDTASSDLDDPSIVVEKCDKLYNLYIEAPMSDSVRTKKVQLIKSAKEKFHRHGVNAVIHAKSINNKFRYCYDPYVSVFNLNPIKPIPF